MTNIREGNPSASHPPMCEALHTHTHNINQGSVAPQPVNNNDSANRKINLPNSKQ